ncbi:NfeD family protein [Halomicroarcula sp. S1AR25-4]|uniref:NfeD family protein n=1 Tax=Haloarcula sp. S1AR25-4 TaxID=2950538 RepID=UPI002876BA03|nr:NfeD family protein [Halomicroarcula sp. S1AR25-4]MDS0277457.1 NfeD family protein [Halomicroarcula sp. S1AR25-4]
MVVPLVSLSLAPAQVDPLFSMSLSLLLFLAGAGLVVAEALAPGTHFFVLGIALLTAGLVGLFIPASLGIFAPIILAVVVLATTAATLWGYRQLDFAGGDRGQTLSSSSLQGQFGTVTERVTKSAGEVKLEDGGFNPYYQARSVDGVIEVGTEVMVVDPGGGNVITVEAVNATDDDIDRALERDRASEAERDTESERA